MNAGGLQPTFRRFAEALDQAVNQGRLNRVQQLTGDDQILLQENIDQKNFQLEVLGPIKNVVNGVKYFKWFEDSSHTRNGHSLVLKISYQDISLLFLSNICL